MAKLKKLDNNLLSVDLGYSGCKAYCKINDKELLIKIPSVVQKLDKNNIDDDDEVIEYNNNFYLVGDEAINYNTHLKLDIKALIENAPLFLYKIIKDNNIDPKDLKIITGLSLKDYNYSEVFYDKLSNFEIDGQKYSFDISLLPQGRGVAYDFYVDKEIPELAVILDIGYHTFDALVMRKGKVKKSESIANDYGINKIFKFIEQKLEKDEIRRTTSELNEIVINHKGKMFVNGDEVDIMPLFNEAITSYIENIYERFLSNDTFLNILSRCKDIIFGGGGAYIIKKMELSKIKEIFKRENISFSQEPYEFSNARGYYIKAKLSNNEA